MRPSRAARLPGPRIGGGLRDAAGRRRAIISSPAPRAPAAAPSEPSRTRPHRKESGSSDQMNEKTHEFGALA